MLISHSNTLDPNPSVITCEFGEVGVIINPGPVITFQTPIPTTGVLAANVAVLAQIVCDGPALDTLGLRSRCTMTVELEFAQTPLPMVQRNTFTPAPNPVKPVLNKFGEVIVPTPDTKLQVPVPTAGLFPFKVAVVAHTV